MAQTYRALSVLLSYPTAETAALMPAAIEALDGERLAPAGLVRRLTSLAFELSQQDLYEAQARYVDLFDRTRSLSLQLYEHVHGESRDRGQAMVELLKLYSSRGLELTAKELPDHLPVFLEFLSMLPTDEPSSPTSPRTRRPSRRTCARTRSPRTRRTTSARTSCRPSTRGRWATPRRSRRRPTTTAPRDGSASGTPDTRTSSGTGSTATSWASCSGPRTTAAAGDSTGAATSTTSRATTSWTWSAARARTRTPGRRTSTARS